MGHVSSYFFLYFLIKCVEGRKPNYLGPNDSDVELRGDFENTKKVYLDISEDVDPKEAEVISLRPYDIEFKHFKAKPGFFFFVIRDPNHELWVNSKLEHCFKASVAFEDEEPLFLSVNCKDSSGGFKDYFLFNNYNSWISVQANFFYTLFNNFVLEKTVHTTEELDISGDLDENLYYVNNYDKFPFVVIVPNISVSIHKLVDSGTFIWASPTTSARVLYVSVYNERKSPLMCVITNAFRRKTYYKYYDNVWNQIKESEYISLLRDFGIDLNTFDNGVTLDLSEPNDNMFIIHSFGSDQVYLRKYSPRPGLKLTKIVDAKNNVWSSRDHEYCNYVGVNVIENVPLLMVLYIKDPSDKHKVEYYVKSSDGDWEGIKEFDYLFYLKHKKLPSDQDRKHKTKPDLETSHFINKQGLKIKTYLSRAENSKGAIILVHGNREYFMSNFLNYNRIWNFETFGYPTFPTINHVDDFEMSHDNKFSANSIKYSHLFSSDFFSTTKFDLNDRSEHSNRFDYECSMVQILNEMGLDVYGLDLQSCGYSESISSSRCYVKEFEDFVDDLLQFVDIVKRNAFMHKETWDEDKLYSTGTERFHNNLFILGYSMGANVVFQAAQKFHKLAPKGVKFVNGLISLSGMMKLDQRFSGYLMKAVSLLSLSIMSFVFPHGECYGTGDGDWTMKMNDYMRLNDGFYYSRGYPFRIVHNLFKATDTLRDQMNHYPKDLPTLFIHCKNDPVCSIQGPKELFENYIKKEPKSEFIELRGNSHETTSPHFIYNTLPVLRNWLQKVVVDVPKMAPGPEERQSTDDYGEKRLLDTSSESATYEVVLLMLVVLFLVVAVIFGMLNLLSRRKKRDIQLEPL